MKILLDIKDSKAAFFMELLKNFSFVKAEPLKAGKAKKGTAKTDKEYEKEHKEFLEQSSILLGMKYDEDEPDISHIKGMPNPKFNPNE